MLYSDEIWQEWTAKIEDGFEIKKYHHLDGKINFPERKNVIKKILSDPDKVKIHSFLPFLKILIKTPRLRYQEIEEEFDLETKIRPISFASHLDSYIYAFYSYSLNKKYQEYIRSHGFDATVLAYRSDLDGKCNIQFAKEVFDFVKSKGECTALALDIKGYFDNIDHTLLKDKWCKMLGLEQLPADQYRLFRSLTKYNYINKNSILKHFKIKESKLSKKPPTLLHYIEGNGFKEKLAILRDHNLIVTNDNHELLSNGFKRYYGIPQGSAMSALLSNIYLIDYDEKMMLKAQSENFLYRRYCDDILIVCDTKRAKELQEYSIEEIKKYYLIIQDKKVELIEFRKNSKGNIRGFNLKKILLEKISKLDSHNEQRFYKSLQYLGFEYNGQDIRMRPGSLSRYFRKMKARIVKTISMAYSQNTKSDKVFKEQIFTRYTHIGKRNFLHYAYNSSKKYYKNAAGKRKLGMDSPAILKQVKKHFDILMHTLKRKNIQRANYKSKKGKLKTIKVI